ncbi:MAG: hypothetical protein HY321_06370 [Armatimonadetes bacterium]|nr:hypothetical protein [Armatimonadota bacterium]
MPTLDYVIPCRLTSIDSGTSALSLFHILDEVAVVAPPSTTPRRYQIFPVEVATRWRSNSNGTEGDYIQTLVLVDSAAHETELAATPFHMGSPRHLVRTRVPPIVLDAPGTYTFRAYLNDDPGSQGWGELKGEYSFDVSIEERLIEVRLTDREKDFLTKPVRGQGGYQSLLRRLQGSIIDDVLALTTTDAERLIRSAQSYGEGGFQRRLRPIVEKVRREYDAIVGTTLAEEAGAPD